MVYKADSAVAGNIAYAEKMRQGHVATVSLFDAHRTLSASS